MPRNTSTKTYPALRSMLQIVARKQSDQLYVKSMKNLSSTYATTVKNSGSFMDWDDQTFNNFISNVGGHFKSGMKGIRKEFVYLDLKNVKSEEKFNCIISTLRNAHKHRCERRLKSATYFINQAI